MSFHDDDIFQTMNNQQEKKIMFFFVTPEKNKKRKTLSICHYHMGHNFCENFPIFLLDGNVKWNSRHISV